MSQLLCPQVLPQLQERPCFKPRLDDGLTLERSYGKSCVQILCKMSENLEVQKDSQEDCFGLRTVGAGS